MDAFETLVDDFLTYHWTFHPVDASFAGARAYDANLPATDAGAPERHARAVGDLARDLAAAAVPADAAARLDARMMRARLAHVAALLERGMPYANPAWYTGEAAFGVISLVLGGRQGGDARAMVERVGALPDFFAGAERHLRGRPAPADWCARAAREANALDRLLGAALHDEATFGRVPHRLVEMARCAVRGFAHALDDLPPCDAASGEALLGLVMREVHGLAETPRELERRAAAAFERTLAELEAEAARLDPHLDWKAQIANAARIAPPERDALATYEAWNRRALAAAADLVTPASKYGLTFAPLPPWARDVAGDLYFLFYRSPAAYHPGEGSTYWVDVPAEPGDAPAPAHNTAAVKLVHAVHHGSIGHHTQNARARSAGSTLARIAGTDCASGIAMLSAGTLVEGWACYAEDLLAEVPDFYTPAERLQLRYFELRNIACALADVRLHLGTWSLDEMRRFYRDDVLFAPSRIWSETTRNSMFPGSRLMYWCGSSQIAALRARSPLGARAFHDALLSYGSAPVAWIGEEMFA
jgi:hypothetical protein